MKFEKNAEDNDNKSTLNSKIELATQLLKQYDSAKETSIPINNKLLTNDNESNENKFKTQNPSNSINHQDIELQYYPKFSITCRPKQDLIKNLGTNKRVNSKSIKGGSTPRVVCRAQKYQKEHETWLAHERLAKQSREISQLQNSPAICPGSKRMMAGKYYTLPGRVHSLTKIISQESDISSVIRYVINRK